MQIAHQYKIEGEHNLSDLETLRKVYGYEFTEEHLEFISTFPGLCFEGSRIVKIDTENTIGTSIIHHFFSVSDILFVLGDETIMEAFEGVQDEEIGSYCILTFSHTETEIFVVSSGKHNKNDIYVYSSITDETVLICNGLENFINNYLYFD